MFSKAILALAAVVAVGVWAIASIHADVALKTLGPTGPQIDTNALMHNAGNIPTRSFAAQRYSRASPVAVGRRRASSDQPAGPLHASSAAEKRRV